MIEVVLAAVIFLIAATALTGVLTSAIASHTVSRERTKAQQIAQEQLERVRDLAYVDVGVTNPVGLVPAAGWNVPAGYTVTMKVKYVNDPGPTSYSQTANYKQVKVTVARTKDGKVLVTQTTYVSPPSRPQYGGLNNANITVTVADYGLPGPVDATVALTSGPSANRTDDTDALGQVPFLALLPTNASAPGNYYDITVTKPGYETLAADLPPSATARLTLNPSQSRSTTIRIFKRATINVLLTDSGGSPFTGPATIKIKNPATGTWTKLTTTDGTFPPIDTLGSNPVLPNAQYIVRAYTATGLCSGDTAKNVPDDYPTTMTTTFTMALGTCPSGTINVNVKQLGIDIENASVVLADGPNDVNLTGTTDASGNVVFTNVPSHATDGYTITARRVVQSTTYTQTATTTVATGSTVNLNLVLPSPTLATVNITVNAVTTPQPGATVTLSNSPFLLADLTATTNGSGVAQFVNIPVGTGYLGTAVKAPYANGTATVNVSAPTTNKTIAMPAGILTVNTTWAGLPVNLADVSATDGTNTFTGTTNASGVAQILVPTGSYTVTATKNGFSGAGAATVTTGGGTANVALPTGTITVNATWASLYAGSAAITITGGPNGGTYTGTTGATTGSQNLVVPATSATYPYTVTVTKSNGTGSTSVTSLAPSGTATANVALTPTKTFTITIQRGGAAAASTAVDLSITGGPNGTAGAAPAYTFSLTTNASGVLPAVIVPQGTSGATYTIKANLTTCGASGSNRSGQKTGQSNTGANTAVTVNMTTTTCPFSPLP
jgi:hypothetical protein